MSKCSGGKRVQVPVGEDSPVSKLVMDRDLNAAINILRLGQSLQALTLSMDGVA
ncbi:MAG: hypothetical protein KKE79_06855 [Actinobacteria bacterium]|nr:hypothetical protein [Actinomycetota bacterium]MBU4240186.1 hypothetical protein [Actinomycetota bacterium]MBU4490339.1 hypothetical protein [Actinomycetota bacterium]